MINEHDINDMKDFKQPSANDKQIDGLYEIPLSKGYVTVVDKETWEDYGHLKWSALETGNMVYAVRMEADGSFVYLHRKVMGAKPHETVDHINGDGLANYRSNLRLATKSQNAFNTPKRKGISKYKGVWYSPNKKKPWYAEVTVEGVKIRLGAFSTENEAGQAYNDCVTKLIGNFARLNVIS